MPPKPPASVPAPSNPDISESPSLPPEGSPSNAPRPKVIDLANAVATNSRIPLLDVVKRRMYRDWLRGARPREIRINYRSFEGALRVDEVDDVLREQAKGERAA
jgi:hypothetical protein